MTLGICNKSAVKAIAKSKKMRVSEEVYQALDALIEKKMEKAMERAKSNHRTTVLKQDL